MSPHNNLRIYGLNVLPFLVGLKNDKRIRADDLPALIPSIYSHDYQSWPQMYHSLSAAVLVVGLRSKLLLLSPHSTVPPHPCGCLPPNQLILIGDTNDYLDH